MGLKIKFKTKLLVVFLFVGIIPVAILGFISFRTANEALSEQEYKELTAIRELKKAYLKRYFKTIDAQLTSLRGDPFVIDTISEFVQLIDEEQKKVLSPEWKSLAESHDSRFRTIAETNDFEDILIITPDGHVIYSLGRLSDLGMVIPESNLRDSPLGRAFRLAHSKELGISDFAPYAPSGGAPKAFRIASVKDDSGTLLGFVGFDIPLKIINDFMQERAGMGETGESYLVGQDKLMRSDSFLDHVTHTVKASFANPDSGSVDTVASREALNGKTDVGIIKDYNGHWTLAAYTPFRELDVTWALIVQIDEDEAFGPVNALKNSMIVIMVLSVVAILIAVFFITRAITKPLNKATVELKTSSEELKVAVQQQATSTTEQATAATQILTTMEELLRSSHQISEATNNAASGIESANNASNLGKGSLIKAIDGIANIQKQVENVTANILDLGEKTHQMDLILQIINELTDQTTILSYNATIEAAGAGESGNRFAAVAEQIMTLANKAKDSTKEIRILIEDIQKSANKTVLLTEESIKAVDEGTQSIHDTSEHFNSILKVSEENLVTSKEVDMTVSQQTTTIDQTFSAVKNVQTAAEEVKSSSVQTLETAEQLSSMANLLAEI